MLETYGAGNGPDSREDLLEEIRAAAKRGVVIVNCTQCLYGHVVDDYATGRVRYFKFTFSCCKLFCFVCLCFVNFSEYSCQA